MSCFNNWPANIYSTCSAAGRIDGSTSKAIRIATYGSNSFSNICISVNYGTKRGFRVGHGTIAQGSNKTSFLLGETVTFSNISPYNGTYKIIDFESDIALLGCATSNQIINFPPITNQLAAIGSNSNSYFFNPGATASSNLPIRYTSNNDDVARGVNGGLLIFNPGSAIITAWQDGDSSYNLASASQTITVIKRDQTINFISIPPQTFTNGGFSLQSYAPGGNVLYSSDNTNVIKINDNLPDIAVIVGAGNATITANQPGNRKYNPAPSVSQTINISKSNQTINFPNIPVKNFGDPNFQLRATATSTTLSSYGLTYTSSNTNVAIVFNENTVAIVGIGTTIITAYKNEDANWNAAIPVSQTLTVNKGNQNINFPIIPIQTVGNPSFNLNVNSTNISIPITYTISNPSVANIAYGSVIDILNTGTTLITANQQGDLYWNQATPVTRTLVVKSNQTITFPSIPTKTFGDSPFNLGATASSNLPIVYTSSNPSVATINGNIVTIVGTGTTTITANQDGNEKWNSATSVGINFTVSKGNQNIDFPSIPTKTFGDSPFNLGATASSNLPIVYTSSNPSVATINGNIVTIVGAGTTTITANQAGDNNWNPSLPKIVTLNINRKQTIINFSPIPSINKITTTTYNLNISSDNNQTPIIYSSSNTNVATVNDNVLTILNPGISTITASQNENANFFSQSVSRNLEVVSIRAPNILKVSNLPNGVYYDEETQYLYGNITDEGNYHTKIYIKEGDRICEKTLKLMVYNPNKKYIYKINYPMNVGFIKYNAPDRIGLKDYIEVYKTSNGDVLRHSRYGVIYAYTGDNITQ